MTTTPAHDAVLTGWTLCRHSDGICISGVVSDDRNVRFRDGLRIRTSPARTAGKDMRQGTVVETQNTRYLLKAPASALTLGMIETFTIWGMTPLDETIRRQLAAVASPVSYADFIDAAIVHVASVPETMRAGDDADNEVSDIQLVHAIGLMEAARAILSSTMLDDAILDARNAIYASEADRAAVNPFIQQTLSPIVEKLECLARLGEDGNAIARFSSAA